MTQSSTNKKDAHPRTRTTRRCALRLARAAELPLRPLDLVARSRSKTVFLASPST